MKISVNAYAKINLFLDIDSLRADGYHNIISHMQSVTLHDIVTIEHTPSEKKNITIHCDDINIPCNESNLAYKAADLYPANNGNIAIHIEKQIPMSAGLAGGSADAAATLIALNQIFENKLSLEELMSLGNRIGADVPFCIKGGSCLATGTGNILKSTAPMPHYPILVAKQGDGMSTPLAYRKLDEKFDKFQNYPPKTDLLSILSDKNSASIHQYSKGFFNIFESVVETERPFVTLIKDTMKENGAVASMMSGSGTAVFAVFENEHTALKASQALTKKGIPSFLCYPLNKR